MNLADLIHDMEKKLWIKVLSFTEPREDEAVLKIEPDGFPDAALFLHKKLGSPVMKYFAVDSRDTLGVYEIYCVFLSVEHKKWVAITFGVEPEKAVYPSIFPHMVSAGLFEREIKEQFGITADGNIDLRRLRLHDEVWPGHSYPMRADFKPDSLLKPEGEYKFDRIEGEGVFEVPVGPVHAGIIGPGHFRFSVAGEPIINLEIRLGWTHRGVEKKLEGMTPAEAVGLCECISGDSSFAHSIAFTNAVEKIAGLKASRRTIACRAVFLELERMYNHAAGIGGIAVDVGFSMPNAVASMIKEKLLALNGKLTGSRFLKGVNRIGGIRVKMDRKAAGEIIDTLISVERDLGQITEMLDHDMIFKNRVMTTGTLKTNTAADLGVLGLAGRASGIRLDLREVFGEAYEGFVPVVKSDGDVNARLRVRIEEFMASSIMLHGILANDTDPEDTDEVYVPEGSAIGCCEGWRGPVVHWVKTGASGKIIRCKVTDPSFRNWSGLAHAAPGNIVPDFPLCNKSFDLSYSGNDL